MDHVYVGVLITNWGRYNPKRAQKSYSWLRLDHDTLCDEKIFDLTPEAKVVWIAVLCEASKRNSDQFNLNVTYLSNKINIPIKKVKESIVALIKRALIKCTTPDYTRLHQTTPDYTVLHLRDGTDETDGTNETNETNTTGGVFFSPGNQLVTSNSHKSEPTADELSDHQLEQAYLDFPRKEGKKRGLEICKREIKTPMDLERLLLAIKNYREKKIGIEPKYLMHFSTFMNQWSDWLDPQTGTTENLSNKKTLKF